MANRKILITGLCGFSGRYLALALRKDPSVFLTGLDRREKSSVHVNEYFQCDITSSNALEAAVKAARPDTVFHLAGIFSSTSTEEISNVNYGGFSNLCESLREYAFSESRPVRLVAVGSAAEIGHVDASQLPVTEKVDCRPQTHYGRSKFAATQLALSEPARGHLQIVVARPFNLIGPKMSPALALGRFALQIAAVMRGEADTIRCGPLDGRRDFVDVRDAVQAYIALAERGRPGQIYNVCAGKSYRIGDLLNRLMVLSETTPRIVSEPMHLGPDDVPDIYGDYSKIAAELGWKPIFSIEQSLRDLLAAV